MLTGKKIFTFLLIIFAIFVLIFIFNRGCRPRGLVAFVVDDWGYNTRNLDLVFQIDRPITLSILPGLRYSGHISDAVRKKARIYDIILHLPLESKSHRAAEASTIMCDMEDAEILSIVEEDIKSIAGIIGVSSHQGSKATEDTKVMKVILTRLKQNKLFFLDSLTTPDSVCSDVAEDIGLKYNQRDVFLDLTLEEDSRQFESYIRKQIHELVSIALIKGSAIGIGHNKALTLKVIKDSIPEMEKQGIKIVPLKKLVR